MMLPFRIFLPLVVFLIISISNPLYSQKKKKKGSVELDQADVRASEFYFIDGEKYFILEDYAKALEAFHKSLDIDSENDVVRYKIAEILFRNEQFEEAKESVSLAININKTNKFYYLLASDIYSALGEYDQSAKMYEQMINRIDGLDEYYFDLASIYIFQNKLNDALRVFDLAERKFGIMDQISLQKQKIYLKQNKIEEAIDEGQRLAEFYPGEYSYAIALSEVMNSNGKRGDAISYLESYKSNYGESGEIDLRLAEYYRQEKKLDESSSLIKKAFQDPEIGVDLKVRILVGYIARFPDSYTISLAQELGMILLDTNPQNGNVLLVNADMIGTIITTNPENTTELKAKAAGYYSRSLVLLPENFGVWQNLLNLDLDLVRWDSLSVHSQNALEYFPNQALIYWFAGVSETQLNNYDFAISYLKQGVRIVSNNLPLKGSFYSSLGGAYNAVGDYANSDNSFDEALLINPNDDVTLNNYSYYLSLRKEKLDKAQEMSESVIKRNPENSTYLDTYAWVLFQLEDYAGAKRVIELVIRNNEASAVNYDHYGDILFKNGEVDKAVENWQKAKSMNKNIDNIDEKINNREVIE